MNFTGLEMSFDFPPVTNELGSVSLTDYTKLKTELLIVYADGRVMLSKAGYSTEFGNYRAIQSLDLRLEKQLEEGKPYKRKFKSKKGPGILTFNFSKEV